MAVRNCAAGGNDTGGNLGATIRARHEVIMHAFVSYLMCYR